MHPYFGRIIFYLIHQEIFIVLFLSIIFLFAWSIILFRNNFKKEAFVIFGSLVILFACFIFIEVVLVIKSYHPGYSQSQRWITTVDRIEVLKSFEADTFGITKYPIQAINYNKKMMEMAVKSNSLDCCAMPDSLYVEVYDTWRFYHDLVLTHTENNFSATYQEIKTKDHWTSFDSLFIQYVQTPVNSDGFKSIPFNSSVPNKKKVLLLGDSFTFGHHVTNITSGFADILLSKGYLVYNTGISGADIMQYYLIAKKYIPIIQPDIVILNAYLGNDLSTYYRNPEPYLPLYYTTNAGNLMTNINGINYSNPTDIYNKILSRSEVNPKSWIGKITCKTRLGTLLWDKFHPEQRQVSEYSTAEKDGFAYIKEIQEIQSLCNALNITFHLVSIPECQNLQLIKAEAYPEFFNNFSYHEPTDLGPLDYVRNNGHFNEQGHEKYANFLITLIEKNEAVN
jgi:hypothetical protein